MQWAVEPAEVTEVVNVNAVTAESQLHGTVDLSNDEYHACAGISKSHLDEIAERSPKHYWAAYLDPNRPPQQQTPALLFGNAIHSAILEPHEFTSRYAVEPEADGRTKAGKLLKQQFAAENHGKTILTADQYETCLGMIDAVHSHRVASGLLTAGVAEESHFSTDAETGALIKCRIDYRLGELRNGLIVDLKTCEDASPRAFGRAAANFRYDIAPPWYYHVIDMAYGVRPAQWVWVCVEKVRPYAIGVYYADEELIRRSFVTARRDFLRILDCRRRNAWPDYGVDILPLEFPAYARR